MVSPQLFLSETHTVTHTHTHAHTHSSSELGLGLEEAHDGAETLVRHPASHQTLHLGVVDGVETLLLHRADQLLGEGQRLQRREAERRLPFNLLYRGLCGCDSDRDGIGK